MNPINEVDSSNTITRLDELAMNMKTPDTGLFRSSSNANTTIAIGAWKGERKNRPDFGKYLGLHEDILLINTQFLLLA